MLVAELTKQLSHFRLEVDLAAEEAQTLVLVGESGAGKTTVLNLLAGLLKPDQGRILVNGSVWFDARGRIFVPPHDRAVGYVLQDYALFPHLSVFENVAFGLRAQGVAAALVREQVNGILEQLGIEKLTNGRRHQLSGGEQQRVALARALVLRPRLLLLDEPLSAIDVQTRRSVRGELRRILTGLPCVSVLVTHSPFEAVVFGERIAVIEDGGVVQVGTRQDLLRHPRSRYVAQLAGVNFFQGRVVSRDAWGMVEVATAGERLRVVDGQVGQEILITVPPREVTLHTAVPTGSAQNVLSGAITELVPEPPFGERVRIVVGCQPPIVSEISVQAVRRLELREGLTVYASFKATAARVYT